MATPSHSFLSETWVRLKKNKGAIIGFYLILFTFFVAIFGYWIAPDNSPNADLQTVEIQAKKIGYQQLFLKIQKSPEDKSNWLQTFWNGKPNLYQYIPITQYKISGDNLTVHKYIDEDTSVIQNFSINQITNNNPTTIDKNIITKKYWLGTDKFGRDILSRLIIGTRVSLSVGLIAVLVSITIGIILGAIAGYYRGWIDEVIMWLINVMWSIPTLLLVFAITMALGKGLGQIFIAIGLTMWISVARLIRGQVMSIKELDYIQAAKALGYNDVRILFKHVLPNILGPIMVIAAANFATAIIIESGLSFLGIGVQPPQPSWGLMIKENFNFIITHNPMLALVPGFAIMLLVLSINLLGNGLRDAVDVKN